MKVGDLVRKKFGTMEVYQQEQLGVVVDTRFVSHDFLLAGALILVKYPNRAPMPYKCGEFEVISESR